MSRWLALIISFSAAVLFWLTVWLQDAGVPKTRERPAEIVITGPVQLILYGGDRFLAANVESVRAAASSTTSGAEIFRLRAHQVVSQLNPCHEDNYWIGNAALSWGGAEIQGFELLRNTMRCRYWDEWPAFFYGFNQHFFRNNTEEARRGLEIAAQRSHSNAAAFRTFSIMLAARKIDDTRAALKMIERERDQATDPKLRDLLDKRAVRLGGLVKLRDAQGVFENQFGRSLSSPHELLESGLLDAFPADPLGLGYEFRDGSFHLRKLNVQ